MQQYVGVYHSPSELDLSHIGAVDGKLVERFGDTAQAFSYRGNGVFTADGIPGDFRLAFTRAPSGTTRMHYVSAGEVEVEWERLADAALWRPDSAVLAESEDTYASTELNVVWELAVPAEHPCYDVPAARMVRSWPCGRMSSAVTLVPGTNRLSPMSASGEMVPERSRSSRSPYRREKTSFEICAFFA